MCNYWFSKNKEAISEQEMLVEILKNNGYNPLNILEGKNTFTFLDAFSLVWVSAEKAFKNKLPITTNFSSSDRFAKKMVGNMNEYLFDAIINSKRFGIALPSDWGICTSKHRAEFGIPDTEEGSPDRLMYIDTKLHSVVSVKAVSNPKDTPKNLNNVSYWANETVDNYSKALGLVGSPRIKCSLFTNGTNKSGKKWAGGEVSHGSTYDLSKLLDGNTSIDLAFWRDFFAEFLLNVQHYKSNQILSKNIKKPDPYQDRKIVQPIFSCFGPNIASAPTGFGKTIIQIAILPTKKSINLYMAGTRTGLAFQFSEELYNNYNYKHHRIYISGMNINNLSGRDNSDETTANVPNTMALAQKLFNYANDKNQYPLFCITLEQSLYKFYEALAIIKNGQLENEDTGELYPWCNDSKKVSYHWNRICELLEDAHYDEAHNLVAAERKNQEEDEIKRKTKTQAYLIETNKLFKRSVYWTATLKLNGSKFDMSNVSVFGIVKAVVTPAEAIDGGYIIPPMLIPVRLSVGDIISLNIPEFEDGDLELTYYIRAIEHAYETCKNNNQNCRLLIFTSDKKYHQIFKEKIIEYFKNKELNIWCDYIESETDPKDRIPILSAFGIEKFSVLMNYNIVTEGINIPSCSGVILGRRLVDIAFIQGIGRCIRLDPQDREDIKNGLLKPGEWWTYRKYSGFVYIYVDLASADDISTEESYKDIVKQLRTANGGKAWWIGPSEPKIQGKNRPMLNRTTGNGGDGSEEEGTTIDELFETDADYNSGLAKILIIDPEKLEKDAIEEAQEQRSIEDYRKLLNKTTLEDLFGA